jgi:tRNA A-37 threonylcarbamoyl transferase component Bud32
LLGICTRERPLIIIMEYLERGSLKDVLRHSKPTSDGVLEILPTEMSRMCYDVASGMSFLSAKGFVHRDVAARFELIRDRYGLTLDLCLSGFVLAHTMTVTALFREIWLSRSRISA